MDRGNVVEVPPLELPSIPVGVNSFTMTHNGSQFVYELEDPKEDGVFIWKRVSFLYDELSDKAKEKARENYCTGDYPWYDWWDSVIDWYSQEDSFITRKTDDKVPTIDSVWYNYRPWFTPEEIPHKEVEFDFERDRYAKIKGRFDLREVVKYIVTHTTYQNKVDARKWKRILIWLEDGTIYNTDIAVGHSHYYYTRNQVSFEGFYHQWNGDFEIPEWLNGYPDPFGDEIQAFLDDEVKEIERDLVHALKEEYEGMFETEYIEDGIRNGDYTFDEDGEMV